MRLPLHDRAGQSDYQQHKSLMNQCDDIVGSRGSSASKAVSLPSAARQQTSFGGWEIATCDPILLLHGVRQQRGCLWELVISETYGTDHSSYNRTMGPRCSSVSVVSLAVRQLQMREQVAHSSWIERHCVRMPRQAVKTVQMQPTLAFFTRRVRPTHHGAIVVMPRPGRCLALVNIMLLPLLLLLLLLHHVLHRGPLPGVMQLLRQAEQVRGAEAAGGLHAGQQALVGGQSSEGLCQVPGHGGACGGLGVRLQQLRQGTAGSSAGGR